MKDRDHPFIKAKGCQLGGNLGYDEVESIVRGQRDPDSVKAIREIDAMRARMRDEACRLNAAMTAALGLTPKQVRLLVVKLANHPELETWLSRRVNLARSDRRVPADDYHPVNV